MVTSCGVNVVEPEPVLSSELKSSVSIPFDGEMSAKAHVKDGEAKLSISSN